jgi:hypothetical protein
MLRRRSLPPIRLDPAMTRRPHPLANADDSLMRRYRHPARSTLKLPFGMAPRQTTELVASLSGLIGLAREMPNLSSLSRREKTPKVKTPVADRKARDTFFRQHWDQGWRRKRVEGGGSAESPEGWFARPRHKHGSTKRCGWRSIHIGIDAQTPECRAADFTTSDMGDPQMPPDTLDRFPHDQKIASVSADGAFDMRRPWRHRRPWCPWDHRAAQAR